MKPQHREETPAIAAAVIVKDDRVLLVRRRLSEGSLLWQFPAGAVEPGESSEDAAVRETREEAGLLVRSARELGSRVHPATGRTMVYVACEFVSGTAHVADDEELDAVAWVDRNELRDYIPNGLFPPVQEHLDSALSVGKAGTQPVDPEVVRRSGIDEVAKTRSDHTTVKEVRKANAPGLHARRGDVRDRFGG